MLINLLIDLPSFFPGSVCVITKANKKGTRCLLDVVTMIIVMGMYDLFTTVYAETRDERVMYY